jgi:hypothetical protein
MFNRLMSKFMTFDALHLLSKWSWGGTERAFACKFPPLFSESYGLL